MHSFISTGNKFNVFSSGVGRCSQLLEHGLARPDYFHNLLMLESGPMRVRGKIPIGIRLQPWHVIPHMAKIPKGGTRFRKSGGHRVAYHPAPFFSNS